MDKTKLCPKCKSDKPVNEFGKDKTRKDGMAFSCKFCASEYKRNYRKENLKKERELDRASYERNKEKISAASRVYRAKYKEQISARRRASYERNKEQLNEKKRKYYKENSVRILAYQAKNKDITSARDKKFYKENSVRLRETSREYRKSLPDAYVRTLIIQHNPELRSVEIPQELIELKRAQLLIARKLKENKS